jgi:Na+/H+ antiporter NhaD/arsenite permease-like protein
MGQNMAMAGFPMEFVFFALVLLGVAVLHHRPLLVTLSGLAVIIAWKLAFGSFGHEAGLAGLSAHFAHEWVVLANLMLLLVGFALLSSHFERSAIPDVIPAILPDNWTGGVVLLAIVFVLSAILDNIAAAVIGGVMARHVYRGNVGVGFLAAIVAAANAGGAGSVLGDTTTTMMWIGGVSPVVLLDAFAGSVIAFAVFAPLAAWRQEKVAPVARHTSADLKIDWVRAMIVLFILACIVATNVLANSRFPALEEHAPLLGMALWGAILVTALIRRPGWEDVPEAFKGAVFLVALVACASLMPVEELPSPTWHTTLGLGFLSAVFDNIPLTALALKQGGYDWPLLAYAMGVGGSMLWFGSSAGVALTSEYPQGRSVVAWLKEGWFVAVAYAAGFFVMLALFGWNAG